MLLLEVELVVLIHLLCPDYFDFSSLLQAFASAVLSTHFVVVCAVRGGVHVLARRISKLLFALHHDFGGDAQTLVLRLVPLLFLLLFSKRRLGAALR